MTSLHERTANRLLGYPDEARLLIVNADDFGMCHANNEATLRAWQTGIVSSTSVMTPCPWAPQALRLLREHPDLSFGVHLTSVCEHRDYRWGLLASKAAAPSLLDEAGYFYHKDRRQELLAQAKLDEVEEEFRAQIETVLVAGLQPAHLDWHCLGDGGRADIFALTLRLANEYGLALRTHGPAASAQCRQAGVLTADFGVLDSYALETAGKADRYAQLLSALPVGLSEWAVHPSLGDAEARAMEPEDWRVRQADFDFLMSQAARDILVEEGIVLVNYRVLQQSSSRKVARGDRAAERGT
ncbi:MAG: polysaccharide deacetylase family protein [Thermomicrobiales bacterium]